MNDVSLFDLELQPLAFEHLRSFERRLGGEEVTVEFDLPPTRPHQLPSGAWSAP